MEPLNEDFKLSSEHEELLDLYIQKLEKRLNELKQKDDTEIDVQTHYLKSILEGK